MRRIARTVIPRRASHRTSRVHARWTVVAAATGTALSFAAVSTSHAIYTLTYCERTVAPMTKCADLPPRHSYDQNNANGVQGRDNAFANKCEKMSWWANESEVWSQRCEAKLSVVGR